MVRTVRLHDFIHTGNHGDDSIAGYLEPRVGSHDDPCRFVYWRSSNAMLPAFVNCLEDGGDMRRVYTNHERAPWVRPRGPGVKRRDNLRPGDGDGSLLIEPSLMPSRKWPSRVSAARSPAPLTGGLHAAALAWPQSVSESGSPGAHVAPGLTGSLHYYALAARTLIALSATCGFSGLHDHVGAILVSDAGAILAAGINTGSYRHAEVSLLVSYFRNHPKARTLPERCLVFSTLTPCRQCTRYLSLAKAPDTLIRFDEADRGRSGRVGERIAEQVGAGRIRVEGESELGSTPSSPDFGSRNAAVAVADTASSALFPGVRFSREAERRAIRNSAEGGNSRLDRAREARRTLLATAQSTRQSTGLAAGHYRGDARNAHQAEAAVLAYLAAWVSEAACVE